MAKRLFISTTFLALVWSCGGALPTVAQGNGLQPADYQKLRATGQVEFSPDGKLLLYSVAGFDRPGRPWGQLWVMDVATGNSTRLGGENDTSGGGVWSPDGRWIAFLRRQWEAGKSELRLIPPLGGSERKVTEIRVGETSAWPPYLAWCPDSNCLVVTDSPGAGKPPSLFVVSIETGEKTQLTNPQLPSTGDTNPAVSPDGSWLVFRRNASAVQSGELYRLPLGKGLTPLGEPRRLTPARLDAEYPSWMPGSREILFSAKGGLWRLVVPGKGTPTRLPFVGEDGLMPVVSRPQPGRPPRLIYARSFQNYNTWRVETSTPGAPASSPPVVAISSRRRDYHPQFSPDGRQVAFGSDRSVEGEVWLADPDGSNAVQLTSMGGRSSYPRWSPDGERIVLQSVHEGQWDIYVMPAMGGKARNLTFHPAADVWPSFSHDGKWIYFNSNRTGEWHIGLTATRDGRTILCTRVDSSVDDLMLVENFR
jgi:dipeptidyl aminopeptidase/acylaminoacyl peptidase